MSSLYLGRDDDRDEREPEPKPKRKNARARYRLTDLGATALATYREAVTAAQASGGRDTLETAQGAWAAEHRTEPSDALLLDELEGKPQTILELTRALDTCGIKRPTVDGGIERMAELSLVEPVVKKPREPPPPPLPQYY